MKKFIFALLVFSYGLANSADHLHTIVGTGSLSCGEHIAGSGEQKKMDTQWAIGFLSGRNLFEQKVDFLRGVDVLSVAAALDDYCSKNPFKFVGDAVGAIYVQLLAVQRK